SRAELSALGRGGAIRRRRIRDPDAGNHGLASTAARKPIARMGCLRSPFARQEHFRQLRNRGFPRARLHAAGTDSGGGLVDVSLETSGRELGVQRGALRRERNKEMEEGCSRGVSGRDAEKAVFNRPGGI